MATFAIGDVHGNLAALTDLLDQITPELSSGDAVVFLGDYIDRGPQSRECVDAILNFTQATSASVVCLLGNHEEWMLRTLDDPRRHSWVLGMSPWSTIASYAPEAVEILKDAVKRGGMMVYAGEAPIPYEVFFDRVPGAHLEFFRGLVTHYENVDGLFSHGGLDPTVPGTDNQTERSWVWGAKGFPEGYLGDKPLVYGHHNNAVVDADGWPQPRITGDTIGIDTIAHGVLTAIRMPDRTLVQTGRYARRQD